MCIFVGFLFLLFSNAKVEALDYNIRVDSVENLVYGNTLKDAYIVGDSDIEGEFVFVNPNQVIDTMGNMEINIKFVASNIDYTEYIKFIYEVSPRKISVVFNEPLYKQCDGSTSIVLPTYNYDGIIENEVNVIGTLKGELLASYVGEDIGVVLSGISIDGEKSDHYYLELNEHKARVYPSVLEKDGENYTRITLEKDVYVDIGYSLKVVETKVNEIVENKYTSFAKYDYLVYSHTNEIMEIDGRYIINMKVNDAILNNERLGVFQLNNAGEYKEIEYQIKDGFISFVLDKDCSVIFATRNIEYYLIIIFTLFLIVIFSFIFIYRYVNMKKQSKYNF